jgi:hypothetical protein
MWKTSTDRMAAAADQLVAAAQRAGSSASHAAAKAASSAVSAAGDVAAAAAERAGQLPPVRLPEATEHLLENVRTGRFERTLSGLTAAASLVNSAEIFLEHDRASFGNRIMWWPVLLGPVGAAAGIAGVYSGRMAKTALPIASLAIVANGIQGTYLHLRGIAQKPGGFRHNARFNIETGPPLLAPLLMTLVGGMGLVSAALRRER